MKALVRIRRARQTDLPRILAIERASFGRDAWDREMFQDFLRDAPKFFLVAEVEGRVAGYSITCVMGTKAELVSIASARLQRRHGVGARLMSHTLRRLRWYGVGECWLMVRMTNETAIRFYRKLGFKRTRRVKHYYEDGADAWRMRLAF